MNIYETLLNITTQLENVQKSLANSNLEKNSDFSEIFQKLSQVTQTITDESLSNKTISAANIQNIDVSPQKSILSEDRATNQIKTDTSNNGLTIVKNIDGSAQINFTGGAMHHVRGGVTGPVNALLEAYGPRIKDIVSYTDLA